MTMRAHRHLHQRLARIEGQQSRLPDDPESLRQRMIRTVQRSLPLDEATAFVNDDPLTPALYDDAMGAACRAMCEGQISPAEARAAMIVIKTRWRARLETDGAR